MTRGSHATLFFSTLLVACVRGNPSPVALADFAPEPEVYRQHTHFPMTPGTFRVYEGLEDGRLRREEAFVLTETAVLWGTFCNVLLERIYLDHEATEITYSWYGQDGDGNVWKFGEETFEIHGAERRRTEDSWVVGRDGVMPSMAFAATPRVGDVYSVARPGGEDRYEVVSVNATATVAFGTFEGCVQILENPDDPDDQDIILYAPGMGKVSEQGPSGTLGLVTTGREFPLPPSTTPRGVTPPGTGSSRQATAGIR